jgi:hypothetical protein
MILHAIPLPKRAQLIPMSLESHLKLSFSSLSKLHFRQPRSCGFNVIVTEFVTFPMPEERYVGAAAFECFPEFFRLGSGDNWIPITCADEYRKIPEIPNYFWREWNHDPEEHGCR